MHLPTASRLTVAFAFVLVAQSIGQQTTTPEPPPTALPQNGTEPAWSPDGTRLAFGLEPKDAERWVYHFAAEGLVRKETFTRSADGPWSRRTELTYSPAGG